MRFAWRSAHEELTVRSARSNLFIQRSAKNRKGCVHTLLTLSTILVVQVKQGKEEWAKMSIKSLEKLPAANCTQFLHRVVDGVCGRSRPQMEDYGNRWSVAEWTELVDTLAALFCFAVGRKCSEEEVKESLLDLDSSYSNAILACLNARHDEIRLALVERTNCISSAQLQDFDWQLKLALSSDKISSLQTPLLNLSLDVKEGGVLRPVSMEMNREELQMLINSLEAANKVVLQLK
ncbi:COMM domain-containing protein 8 [Arapaima gigas]